MSTKSGKCQYLNRKYCNIENYANDPTLYECEKHLKQNHHERMEENAGPSKCRKFKVSGSFARARPKKTLSKGVRRDLEEFKVGTEVPKGRNIWKSFIKTSLNHAYLENSH